MNYHGGDIHHLEQKVLDFSTNINPLGVPDSFRRALMERLAEFTRYPDLEYRTLRQAVGEYLQVPAEWILPGNGAVDIIYKIAAVCGCQKAVIVCPTFSEYKKGFSLAGVPVTEKVLFHFSTGRMDLGTIGEELAENSILIVCNPNNPTGSLIDREELLSLLEKLQKKHCLLFVDEAFIEFSKENASVLDAVKQFDCLIVLRAATKFFGMPGIRLGYGITQNQKLLKRCMERAEPWQINTAAVIAASVIYKDAAYIAQTKAWIQAERDAMYTELKKIEGITVYPSWANFFLCFVKDASIDADRLFEGLLEKQIFIRKSEGFTGLDRRFFRCAVKGQEENRYFISMLKQVIASKV